MATRIKSTTEYRRLVAALGSEDKALDAYYVLHPEAREAKKAKKSKAAEVDPRVTELLNHGFTEEQARQIVAADVASETEAARPLTSKERGEALVAEHGYTFTSGRVYANGSLAEAIVRVCRTGKPEIVQSSGVGRTKAVLVYKTDNESGDAVCQNLSLPV